MKILSNWITYLRMTTRHIMVAVVTFFISTTIFANPVLDNVGAGQVNIQQTPNSTVINQSSPKAIINWQSFNIGAQESTHFQQPAGGVALNRINPSQGVSQIYGRLTATGQIILVNPAGIFFGPGAYVNVGGLIASTANISDQDFLNNYYRFANVPGYNGAIVNQGQIIAANNGLIALVGGAVSNEGFIQANLGQIVLASGNAFTMTFAGNDMIGFSVDGGVTQRAQDKNGNQMNAGVNNTGTLMANGGKILISAKDAAGVLDNVINMSGFAQAQTVLDGATPRDGEIIILGDNDNGIVNIDGMFDLTGMIGGKIDITGHNIFLDNHTFINASGDAGGGTIRIGGDYLGKGSLETANALVMADGARIDANALTNGNGGKIILWSDNYTNVNGTINATGGSESGDGGFVETSSKNILNVGDILVNTLAPNGETGEWLLDPYDITISSSATSGGAFGGGNPNIFTPTATANVQASTISTNLGSSNVTITTGGVGTGSDAGDITLDGTAAISWANSNLLTLTAYHNIVLAPGSSITSTAGGRLNLIANNAGDYAVGSSGNGTITNGGTLNINGAVNLYYNPTAYTAPVSYTNTGAGTLIAYMNVNNVTDLQNMNTNLNGNYALSKNIDASATSGWNAGAGFAPVGNITTSYDGNFDGQGFTISNLYINRTGNYLGLFGATGNGTKSIKNVTLQGSTIIAGAGSNIIGTLIGHSYASVTNANSYNLSITGINPILVGGLIGSMPDYGGGNTNNNLVTSGTITITGAGSYIGGIVGSASPSINYSTNYTNINAPNSSSVGGIKGYVFDGYTGTNLTNYGNIIGSTSVGGITGEERAGGTQSVANYGNVTGTNYVGGIFGFSNSLYAGYITYAYNAGNIIASTGVAGGIAGASGPIADSYNTGSVSGVGTVGGIVGFASVDRSYNSGAVSGTGNVGALTGNGSATNSLWDTATSLVAVAAGTGTLTNVQSGTFTGVTGVNLSSMATYSGLGFNISSTINTSSVAPSTNWYIFDGSTRPMLSHEYSTNITNVHQLQLAGSTLGASYTLTRDINLSTGMNNAGDIWGSNAGTSSGAGFIPIGSAANNFGGSFNGSGYALSNLYINSANNNLGLFGYTSASSVIQNLGLIDVNVTQQSGGNTVGGLVGFNQGLLSRVFVSGSVRNLTDSSGVDGFLGGIAGQMNGASAILSQSYSTATVSVPATTNPVTSNYVGGLVGRLDTGSSIDQSYFAGFVNAANLISAAGALGVGGLSGWTSGTITNSYNTGVVIGQNYVGGLAGFLFNGTISDSYSTGRVFTYATNVGGITSDADGGSSISRSFWDTATTGQAAAYSSGGATVTDVTAGTFDGTSGVNLSQSLSLYTSAPYNWSSSIWDIIPNQSYPYLKAFYSSAPRAISGMTPGYVALISGPYVTVNLAVNGSVLSTARSGANNFIYFLEGDNQVGLDHTIADGAALLLYVPGAFNITGATSNVAIAPTGGGSLSGSSTFGTMTPGMLTLGNASASTLSNTLLNTAKGAISDSGIVYSVDGSQNLTLNSGVDFVTNAVTTYNLTGNLSVTNADMMIDGALLISTANTTLTTNTTGDIVITNSVNGGGNALTINTVGTSSSISGLMTNLSNFTKAGSGTLSLPNANSFTGGATFTAGILNIGNNSSLGGTSNTITGNGGTLTTSTAGINLTNPFVLTADSTFGGTNNFTLSGNISGNFALLKTGSNVLSLRGTNTFGRGPALIINGGTVNISSDAQIGSIFGSPDPDNITIGSGGILQIDNPGNTVAINSDRGIMLTSGGGVLQTTATTTLNYDGIIDGAFGLTFDGPGNFTIGGDITAPSSITANANIGAFNYGGTQLSASAGSLTLNAPTTLTNSGAVTLSALGASSDVILGGGLTWTGSNAVNVQADRNIIINAAISGINGTLNLTAANTAQSITTGSSGSVDVNNFNLVTSGQWYQNTASLPGFNVRNNFQINNGLTINQNTSFIRVISGNGTSGTPYTLVDVYGLQGIGSNNSTLAQSWALGSDIEAVSSANWTNGSGFVPIGYGTGFTGNITGRIGVTTDNYEISNLYINLPSASSPVGLFSMSTNAGSVFQYLGLTNVNITGNDSVGALYGSGSHISGPGFVTRVYVNHGNVSGVSHVGGLMGFTVTTNMSNLHTSNLNVYGSYRVGGLYGRIFANGISNIYTDGGTVTGPNGSSEVGGIAGNTTANSVSSYYNSANIMVYGAAGNVGGIAGIFDAGSWTNGYNIGSVTVGPGSTNIGGIGGFSYNGYSNIYNAGLVTAPNSVNVGAIIGSNGYANWSNVYFDSQTSGVANAVGAGLTGGMSGLTTAQMQSWANFSGWNISNNNLNGNTNTTVFTGSTAPAATWIMFEGQTRPMLQFEWSATPDTAHAVQLIGAATAGNYTLKNNVDMYAAMRNTGDVWATNQTTNTGSGFVPIANDTNPFTGTLDGDGNAINNLYINRTTSDNTVHAGLFSTINNGSISNLALSDATIIQDGPTNAGLLVGLLQGTSTLSSIFTSGSISLDGTIAGLGVGGLVGATNGSPTISYSYSTASVEALDATTSAGGLIGTNTGTPTITNTYSSGSVDGTVVGGLIGTLTGGTVTNSFWDTNSSGQATSAGTETGLTTAQMKALATFTSGGWSSTAGVDGSITNVASTSATAPNYTWFIFEGLTRPMLMLENNASISNSHQVQMMGAALGKNYALSNHVYAANDMDKPGEVWGSQSSTFSGSGYVPINNYSGILNGNRFMIDGLYINGYTHHGLFASTTSAAYIMNIGITGGSVTGGSYVSGLVGLNAGHILNSYNTSTLRASGSYLNYMGGIAGYNTSTGVITNSYNSGVISTIADGGAFGSVGGVVGYNLGQINTSYNTGSLNGYTQFNGNFGGIAGVNDSTGSINNSYNAGYISGGNSINATGFGGVVGNNMGTITNAISYGYVAVPGGSNFTGGFAGINTGTITGSFWDTDASGRSIGVASGSTSGVTGGCFSGTCSNGGTANLASNVAPTTYTSAGWDTTTIWNIIEDKSYPYLRAFYSIGTPRAIAGSAPGAITDTINLAVNGAVFDTSYRNANGSYYFLEGYNSVSNVNHFIYDNVPILVYLSSGSAVSNTITSAPTSFGSLSGSTALTLLADTVTAGNAGTSSALSNSLLSLAKGSLASSYILYSVDGSNNLTLNANKPFQTTSTTTYTINGNMTANNAAIIFNGATAIGSTNPVIATTTTGNITFGNTVAGNGNSFTVNNPGGTSATFNGAISGSGTALTKLGAGTLALNSAASSFTGGVFLHGGSLTTATLPSIAGNSIIGTGNLSVDNGASLIYTNAGGTFNRSITIGSAGATLQTQSGSGNTLTLTGGMILNGNVILDIAGGGPTNLTVSTTGISGTGAITKNGTGVLSLNAASTYSGGTTLNSGTLIIGADSIGSPVITSGPLGTGALLMTGGVLAANGTFNILNPYTIASAGTVIFDGSNPLTLSGTGALTSGELNISGGTINLAGNLSGSAPINALNTGNTFLTFSGDNNSGYSGDITFIGYLTVGSASNALGTGSLIFALAGANSSLSASVAATVNNNYTVQNGGSAAYLSGPLTLGGIGTINNGATLYLSNASGDALTLSGNLTGSGTIINSNGYSPVISGADNSGFTGTFNLSTATTTIVSSATNALGTGALIINNGFLTTTLPITLGNSSVTITGNASLTGANSISIAAPIDLSSGTLYVTNTAGTVTLSGNMSGAAALNKQNAGTLLISGADNSGYLGTTTLSDGQLSISSLTNALGTGTGNTLILNGGTLVPLATGVILNNNYTVNGAANIATGSNYSLTLNGTGSLNSGSFSIDGTFGTVNLAGALSGSAPLNLSATTSGAINIGGALVDNSSYTGNITATGAPTVGIYSPTFALGTGGTVTLAGGGLYAYTNTIITNPINMTAGGSLRGAAGTLTLTGPMTLSSGTLSILNSVNAINLNGDISGSGGLFTQNNDGVLTFAGNNTSWNGDIQLNGTGSVVVATALNPLGTGTVTMQNSSQPISSSVTSGPTVFDNNFIVNVFGGTFSGVNDMTFNGSFDINTLTNGLTISNTGTTRFNGNITGSSALFLNAGTVVIGSSTANNSYSGDVNLGASTLRISTTAANALGTGTLYLSGGNLQSSVTATLANPFTLTASSTINGSGNLTLSNNGALDVGTLTVSNSDITSLSGVLSSAGGLTLNSATGTLNLNSSNSYTGATNITSGTLNATTLANNGSVSSIGAGTVLNIGATGVLQYTGAGAATTNRTIGLTGSGAVIDASGGLLTLTGNVTGNTFGLVLTGTGAGAMTGVIGTTTGTLTKSGTGTWTLTAANTYSGATNVTGGTLEITDSNVLGGGVSATTLTNSTLLVNGSFNLANAFALNNANITVNNTLATNIFNGAMDLGSGNNTFTIASGSNTSFNAATTGSGNLIKDGAGTLNLVGARAGFSGNITIDQGAISTDDSAGLGGAGSITVNSGAMLGFDTNGSALTFNKAFTMNGGTLSVGDGNVVTIASGGSINLASGNNTFETNATALTIDAVISGSGALNAQGDNTLTLTGNNTYSGLTNINGGILSVASSANLGDASVTNNITFNGGTLVNTGAISTSRSVNLIGNGTINTSADFTINSGVSGNGALTKDGANTLVLANNNTYSGGTTISAGTLQIGNGGATGSISGAIVNNGVALVLNTSNSISLANTISGSGALTLAGGGTFTLSGNNSFSGLTTISSGILNVNHINALGNTAGGTVLGASGTLNINGVNVGAEALTLNGGQFNGVGTAGFGGAITLNNDSVISNNGGSFTLGGTMNGTGALQLSGTGLTTLDNAVGGLASVNANTNLAVNGGGIATIGNQNYFNAVTVGNDAVFATDGSGTQNITFYSSVAGGANNITLSGTQTSGTPTYQFSLQNISAQNVNVNATNNSVNNVLSLNSGATQNFTISANNTGSISGISTVTGTFDFSNIQNLNGGGANDNFIFSGGARLNGSINGGAGVNSLTGSNVASTWIINANNGGQLASAMDGSFANIQNLTGGSGDDAFNFAADNLVVSGMINGGAGNNSINFDSLSDSLLLYLSMPIIPHVLDAGSVYAPGDLRLAEFTSVGTSTGNNIGYIILPDYSPISVTYYTPLSGFIDDPFYFNGWIIGNPPAPIIPISSIPDVYIAPIVNQPITNAYNNYPNIPNYYNDTISLIVNETYTDPLLSTTNVVETGSYCYRSTVQ